jgi:hypothetical protein
MVPVDGESARMTATNQDAIRREQQRKERQAAELRANLARRKAQKREQSTGVAAQTGADPAKRED